MPDKTSSKPVKKTAPEVDADGPKVYDLDSEEVEVSTPETEESSTKARTSSMEKEEEVTPEKKVVSSAAKSSSSATTKAAPTEASKKAAVAKASKPGGKTRPKKRKKKSRRGLKIGLSILVILLIVIAVPLAFVGFQAMQMKATAEAIMVDGQQAVDALKAQDLVTAREKLDQTNSDMQQLTNQYATLSFLNMTPLRWHYQDGQRAMNAGMAGIEAAQVVVNSVEPYADVLGLKGEGTFTGGTIEDRIVKILETLQEVAPALDEASNKLEYASNEIDQIDPARYPFEIQGQSVESLITQASSGIDTASNGLNTFIPVLKVLPSIAGIDGEKKYLVMFQNDGEIRPTGGFMTAYSVLKIDKGKVTPEKSDDIYELDNKFNENLQPPEPIAKYLPTVKVWHLRDMNLSPDFKESMDTFTGYYNELPGETEVEGVIAIDTQVLSNLLTVLGPVDVPGYGTYTTEINPRCNCPDVIYQLEDITTRPTPYHRSDRKAILGPMMATILQKAYDAPQEIWPQLFQTVLKDVNEKHILFYFFDEENQTAVEQSNFAGRIQQGYEQDYLHINDANFGGAKSNIFISQEVEQEIELTEAGAKKTVTMVYKNPQKADNCNLEAGQLCLNGILRSWVRLYVPPGSELIDSAGFEEGTVEVSEDLGYTVIEGFYTVNPLSQTKLVVSYQTPYQPGEEYTMLIQKQPGTKLPAYTVSLNGQRQEFELDQDQEVVFEL